MRAVRVLVWMGISIACVSACGACALVVHEAAKAPEPQCVQVDRGGSPLFAPRDASAER